MYFVRDRARIQNPGSLVTEAMSLNFHEKKKHIYIITLYYIKYSEVYQIYQLCIVKCIYVRYI